MKGCGTFRDLPSLPKRAVPNNLAAVGRKLRELREAHDVSLGELARFMNASVAKLSDLETGHETDPRFQWCPKCGEDTWRTCKNCDGKGYVPK